MTGETTFLFVLVGASIALFGVLVLLPTGKLGFGISAVALVGISYIAYGHFTDQPTIGQYIRSIFWGALTGSAVGAVGYHALRFGKAQSWIFRGFGFVLSVAAALLLIQLAFEIGR